MKHTKTLFYLVLALCLGTGTFLAIGPERDTTVRFEQASAEGEIPEEESSTTTSATEVVTTTPPGPPGTYVYIDPVTGETVETTDPTSVPPDAVVLSQPADQEDQEPSVSEGEPPAGEPEPETTTTTEAPPPPPTTTTTIPRFDHRVQINVEGPLDHRASVDVICTSGYQSSWSASGGQVLDTQTWTDNTQFHDCWVQWNPQGGHIDFTLDDIEVVTVQI